LGGLLDQFRQNGLGDRADSWVNTGPNQGIDGSEVSQGLGDDLLEELSTKTGLTREEIVSRLSRDLPRAVDDLTPEGRIPEAADLDAMDRTPSPTSVPSAGRPA
jgi:uncharacterized protein YidB (DUF937 family)